MPERRRTWQRPPSRFRGQVVGPEPGRYHLYVSWACPWAHRTIIGRRLKGLEEVIGMSAVSPIRDERGWAFAGGEYADPVNGFAYLSEAYLATEERYDGRISVPVLWDTREGRIVNNESADILRMFSTVFEGSDAVDLYPLAHRAQIDELNARLYSEVNDAVYSAGFGRDQEAYEETVHTMFATLAEMDDRLATRRFLFGAAPVETDWRLFTTLVRFDAVYSIHFKCSLRRVVDHPNLWPYVRDLYQWPKIAETVRMDEIRDHYYRTHPSLNPSGIVAVMPDVDFAAPHGRDRVGRRRAARMGRGPRPNGPLRDGRRPAGRP